MTPYYHDAMSNISIFCGDARTILPTLPVADVVITDPVWPNAVVDLFGADDPIGMFASVMAHVPAITDRLVVHLGCDSDPRFLTAVPDALPFLRTCWLEYAVPHHKGRVLYTSDVAYVFGMPPASMKGAHLMPGRVVAAKPERRITSHPCPRKYEHVRWLVRWFARGLVIDPFMGSGQTLAAAKHLGFPAIGIEINESYCDAAVIRLQQSVLPLGDVA